MNALFSLVLIACATSAAQAIFSTGNCFTVPTISDFSAQRYTGNWYEIKRFNSVFERTLKCGRATYEIESANSISVENTGVNKVTGEVASVYGSATVINAAAPNKLSLVLPVQVAGITVLENEGEYSVWDTDYDNYALVYSCKQIVPNLVKAETVWILSRQRTISDENLAKLTADLKVDGFDASTFEVVDQTDC